MIVLTFDVEEFDTPLEYQHDIAFDEQIRVSTDGLKKMMDVVDSHGITTTCFTTATFALAQQELMRQIGERHEIGSHTYYHSAFKTEDLLNSRLVLEKITGKPVHGFRMPRLAPVSNADLIQAGYRYNSSLNPTWIPGRYNHLNKPRRPFFKDGLLQVPASVSPVLRIPLFWLSFKNFPMWWLKMLMKSTLRHDGIVSLYFHPWEFTDITSYGLPGYMSRMSGPGMLHRLDETITLLRKHAPFITMNELAEHYLETNGGAGN